MYKEHIHNPITGETLHVLESNEEVFRIEFAIRPNSAIAAEHLHPAQNQTIYVIEGQLGVRMNGEEYLLEEGESIRIPAGTPHFQWNPTDREARAIEEIKPAGRIHSMFRVAFALAREGKTDSLGVPTPLIGAAFVSEFKDIVRPTSLGLRVLFSVLGPVSYVLGYRRIINEYIERFEIAEMEETPVIPFAQTAAAKRELMAGGR